MMKKRITHPSSIVWEDSLHRVLPHYVPVGEKHILRDGRVDLHQVSSLLKGSPYYQRLGNLMAQLRPHLVQMLASFSQDWLEEESFAHMSDPDVPYDLWLITHELIRQHAIGTILPGLLFHDEPHVFTYHALDERGDLLASGASVSNAREAYLKVLAEAVERRALFIPVRDRVKTASADSLAPDVLDIRLLAGGFSRRSDAVYQWVRGVSLTDKKPVWLPAQLVFWGYERPLQEPLLWPRTTNGTAVGLSLEDALYRALCELIERDAVMAVYFKKIAPPQITLNAIDDHLIQYVLGQCKRYRIELTVFDITTDIGIPTMLAITVDRSGYGASVTVGSKADLDPIEAVRGAITGALRMRLVIRARLSSAHNDADRNSKRIQSSEERALYWARPGAEKNIAFLFAGRQKTRITKYSATRSSTGRLKAVVHALQRGKNDIYYYESNHPVSKVWQVSALRAIVPQLIPLSLDDSAIVGSSRFNELAHHFGYPNNQRVWNDVPHFFT